MTFRKKSLTFPVQLPIVVSVLALLLGAETVGAQIRTVLVSPVPGDPVASGTALRNALVGIPPPSATDRWLLQGGPVIAAGWLGCMGVWDENGVFSSGSRVPFRWSLMGRPSSVPSTANSKTMASRVFPSRSGLGSVR